MHIKYVFSNKFFLFLLVIITLCVIYQFFFRYEYKVYKADMPIFSYTVKLDKLTGKSLVIPNENFKRYVKRKETEEKQVEDLNLNDYKKRPKKGEFRYEDYLKK